MEHPPSDLRSPPARAAFTLVEVLIALAITAVVMGLAWIVLDSTRKVAGEIGKPIHDPVDPFWEQLQQELDRLLPAPALNRQPPLNFSPETGLKMVALLPDADGVPLQTELHYFLTDNALMKIRASGFPPAAQTNLVSGGIRAFSVMAESEGQTFQAWPPEKASPLPPLLLMELESSDGHRSRHTFYLPASFRIKKAGVTEESSDS